MPFPSTTGPNSYIWNLKQVYNARLGNNWPSLPNYTFFAGGGTGTNTNIIDYVEITSTGNATDFGDLSVALFCVSGLASTTRGVMAGGGNNANTGVNTIEYVTMSTKGNATNFGNLNANARVNGPGTLSNSTRGIIAGGEGAAPSYPLNNIIEYITIASVGNATDFGDLSSSRYVIGGTASSTRGVFAGGNSLPATNIIEYITIATTGNTTDFGDLTNARSRVNNGVVSSGTRGVFAGGLVVPSGVNTIDYITIASVGNATDFGDLLSTISVTMGSGSNLTRGVFGGGDGNSNVIQYVTIATTGNALDFGDLTVGRTYIGGFSNANGGLQ
jgi:hypothetical protein